MRKFEAPYGTSSTSAAAPSCEPASGEGGGSSAALLLEDQPGTARALAWMTDGKREMLNGSRPGPPRRSKWRSVLLEEMAKLRRGGRRGAQRREGSNGCNGCNGRRSLKRNEEDETCEAEMVG